MRGRNGHRALEGRRILLVEDATDIREAFAVLLEAEGARVTAAATGREAAEAASRQAYDVLLTDLGLPDTPGEILIRQVLATARVRPRVVVVTGYGEPYGSRAREAGADAVLLKPVEWTDLLEGLAPAGRPATVAA